MSETCIDVRNLSKSFNGRKVVNNLSFSVERGRVFGLLGHNGAGKSTTIEMILGLKAPDEGTAVVFGKEVAKHKKESFEKIGVQLQASYYQPSIRVGEACRERAALYRNPRDYKELLGLFELSDLIKSPVNKLSGGEKQRVAVARALINKPDVVLADEPSGSLDSHNKEELYRLIFDLRNRLGQTFVIVTHDEALAQMTDRTIHIIDGMIG